MFSAIKTFFGGVSALALTACSPVNVLNAMVPSSGYHLTQDISYGATDRLKLDIYQPLEAAQEPSPTVVFFYGGGWEKGNRKDYKFVAEALTSKGITVVIPDYRVYPEVVFPEFLDDAAAAVAWTAEHIEQFGGDADLLFVVGHSAGAHIAALLSLNPDYLAQHALSPEHIKGVIGLAGPYDFLPLKSRNLKTIFGAEALQWQSQPINHVATDHPPMLLLVGGKDSTVLPRNSYRLAEKLAENGNAVELVSFEDFGHVAMVAKLARPLRGEGDLLLPIIRFIRQHAPSAAGKVDDGIARWH